MLRLRKRNHGVKAQASAHLVTLECVCGHHSVTLDEGHPIGSRLGVPIRFLLDLWNVSSVESCVRRRITASWSHGVSEENGRTLLPAMLGAHGKPGLRLYPLDPS